MNSKQISIITFDSLSNDRYNDLILSIIAKRTPTVLINIEKYADVIGSPALSNFWYSNPRENFWFCIILRKTLKKSHGQKIQDAVKFMNKFTKGAERPKF